MSNSRKMLTPPAGGTKEGVMSLELNTWCCPLGAGSVRRLLHGVGTIKAELLGPLQQGLEPRYFQGPPEARRSGWEYSGLHFHSALYGPTNGSGLLNPLEASRQSSEVCSFLRMDRDWV